MSGAAEPLYVEARSVLLDALDALREHRDSIILVGAQAVYMHTGAADMAVAEYTTDADLALDPRRLQPLLELAEALTAAGFRPSAHPGTWISAANVELDLLVPNSLGGGGRRAARPPGHGSRAARKAAGLEAVLVDCAEHQIVSLDPNTDRRSHVIKVAGPAALLVAKLHKIAGTVSREAIAQLRELFASPAGLGAAMAARAVGTLADPQTIRASCAALATDLAAACGER